MAPEPFQIIKDQPASGNYQRESFLKRTYAMYKICTKCKEERALIEFSLNKTTNDGLQSWCKTCINIAVKKYRDSDQGKRKIKKYRQSEIGKQVAKKSRQSENGKKKIEEYRHSERGKEWTNKYCQSEKGKAIRLKHTKKWREANPIKLKAQTLIKRKVRSGKIIRMPCQTCGDVKSHGHHCDYSKPLEVMWLCHQHHRLWHSENGPGING